MAVRVEITDNGTNRSCGPRTPCRTSRVLQITLIPVLTQPSIEVQCASIQIVIESPVVSSRVLGTHDQGFSLPASVLGREGWVPFQGDEGVINFNLSS